MEQTPQTMPITYNDSPCGAAELRREGLYLRLRCSCELVSQEILRLYATCHADTLCLGVLIPEHGRLLLDKKVPASQLAQLEGLYIAAAPQPAQIPYDPAKPLAQVHRFRQLVPVWRDGKLYLILHTPS